MNQNAEGCTGEVEHKNQVKRPNIRVDGPAVSRTDHESPNRQDRVKRGTRHDSQAPVAEFGEKIMYMMSKKTSKSGPKVDAKFHDGIWLGLRMKSDESMIGTLSEVVKAKTVRRLRIKDGLLKK